MALIAIDMTPILPGGVNGGAKLLALELIKGFQAVSGDNRFLVLTASWNEKELASLDSPNTQRLCVINVQDRKDSKELSISIQIEERLRRIYRFLPGRIREKLWKSGLLRIAGKLREIFALLHMRQGGKLCRGGPLSANGVDVLFCPFTNPTRSEPGIPVVSVVHDLQHRDYPQFFSPNEISTRETFFNEVRRRADAIICVSESTRQSVIRHLKTDPDKTHTVYNCIQARLEGLDSAEISEHLRDLHITEHQYMFYPANFWPHKNHLMLITAYGMYLSRNSGNAMDLVFTGALDDAQRSLKDKIRRMGLEGRVHFLGYLSEDQLMAVWKGCYCLVFPSLYEGFGIPVLEAMQFGKPVICSNVTSLPEVAGDAALYFDPRKPWEILQCLERITVDCELYNDLVKRGYENLVRFQPQDMVNKYLQYIEGAISAR